MFFVSSFLRGRVLLFRTGKDHRVNPLRSNHVKPVSGFLLLSTIVLALAGSAFAASYTFTPTSGGTYDANASGNWNPGLPANTGTDANFIQTPTGNQTVTNFLFSNPGTINYLRLATGGSSLLTVITASGVNFTSAFGLVLHANDTLNVNGGIGTISTGNASFDDASGTLIVSNGGSVFVNEGTISVQNVGTISIVSAAGQTGTFNTGNGTAQLQNMATGTMIANGSGTAVFATTGTGGSQSFLNLGTMTANSGTMIMNTASATSSGGFSNGVGGVVNINNGSTFLIARSAGNSSGWDGSDSINLGSIVLSGTSQLGALRNGSTFTGSQGNGSLRNYGTISGNGTVSAPLFDNGSGRFIASGGTLTFTGNQYGSSATWVSTNVGATANVLNFAMGNNATLAGATMLYSNGTIQISNGTVLYGPNNSFRNDGTVLLSNGTYGEGTLTTGQTYTNSQTGVIIGQGTFASEAFGVKSYSFINSGSIIANNGSLFIRTGDSQSGGGFSNTSSGTILVTNGATFGIMRANSAWTANDAALGGSIILSNGTLKVFTTTDFSTWEENTGATNGAIDIVNGGKISGWGTITAPIYEPAGNSAKIQANNGTLTIGRVYAGAAGGDTWIATNVGAQVNTLSFNGGNAGKAELTAGTLLNSNGAVEVTAGELIFPTNYFRNDGTLMFTGGGGSMAYVNSATLARFTNSATGVITGKGTLTLGYGTGANNNYAINNFGLIKATGSGTLWVDPNDALVGFINGAGATVQVDSGSTFVLSRSANEWGNVPASVPTNNGTIFLNGGTFTFGISDNGSLAATQNLVNTSMIIGQGTLAASVRETSAGQIVASNGVLNILGGSSVVTSAVAGASAGSLSAVNGGTLRLLGVVSGDLATNATWVVNSGGTIQVAGGGAAAFNSSGGTILIEGGTYQLTNLSGAFFTNTAVGVIAGSGTVQTGYGNGNENSAVVNLGNMFATNSNALLTFQPENKFNNAFSNAMGGTITISNGASFAVQRTSGAWAITGGGGDTNVVNAGNIVLNSGTFQLSVTGGGIGATNRFRNVGTITGQGLVYGTVNNAGTIIANGGGSLIFAGSDSSGGFSNAVSGFMEVNANSTLEFLNTNLTSAVNFTNLGSIVMNSGSLIAGTIGNSGAIVGLGAITGTVVNAGSVLASNLTANLGTLTVSLSSFTNVAGATIGTIGTNTTLNVLTPGGANVLINNGIVNISGGTIVFNNGTAGTITNFNTIGGVGNVSSLPIVNVSGSSFLAQNPIPGLNTLIAQVGITNNGLLGANGGATLQLTVTGGGNALVNYNNSTIEAAGGFVTINGGGGIISNLAGQVFGNGTQNLIVVNQSGGTLFASNGLFKLGMAGVNAGVISNYNSLSTVDLTNTVLVNTGRISLNGGGLIMGGSVITNDGTITGPGNYSSGLYNDTNGTVVATGGTLGIATNGPATEAVNNIGTITVQTGGTLQVGGINANAVTWNNSTGATTGQVVLAGTATVTGGILTNAGTITGNGSFNNNGLINAVGGTITLASGNAINVVSNWSNTAGTVALSGGTLTGGAITNTSSITGNGAISSVLGNYAGGTLTVSGGALLLTQQPSAQNGNITIASSGTLAMGMTGGTFTNGGTISLYGGLMVFTNNFGNSNLGSGTFLNTGVIAGFGTNSLDVSYSTGGGGLNRNPSFINKGTIIASNGLLMVNVADGFTQGGFSNASSGIISITNGATFGVNRTVNAWTFDGNRPKNEGTIAMNGGTLAVFAGGVQVAGGVGTNYVNDATIIGSGTIAASVAQSSTGIMVASNGVLNIFANGATVSSGGPSATDFGTFKAVSGGTLKINSNVAPGTGYGGVWAVNNGSTLDLGGNAVDLGNAFMPGSSLNGTVVITTGAGLTLSSSTGGQTYQQNGTFAMSGGSVDYVDTQGLQAFTNAGWITGNGTFQTGYRDVTGGNGEYAIVNQGTILANASSPLYFVTQQSTNTPAFINGTNGFVQINTNGSVIIDRFGQNVGEAWNTANLPTNQGTIFMNGGTLAMTDLGSSQTGYAFANSGSGTIQGNGTIVAAVQNAGTIDAQNGTLTLFNSTTTSPNYTVSNFVEKATGVLQADAGGTLLLSNQNGLVTFINGGTINANGGSIIAKTISNQNVITGFGTIAGGGVINQIGGAININASNTLTFTNVTAGSFSIFNQGTIAMNGGTLVSSAVITNAGTVAGFGTVTGGGVNDGVGAFVYALTNGANAGTLTVQLNSFTNGNGATIGTIGTNAVLNLLLPGLGNVLINNGTISVSGGTILFSGGTGTITNFNTIAGVGDVTQLPVINQSGASFVAQNPIPGLSNLIASVGTTNNGILGGKNGATLSLTVGGGGTTSLVNQGTINLNGGFITFNGGQGSVSNVSGGFIYGSASTESNLNVVNLTGGTVMASNGSLRVGLLNNLNQGLLSNYSGSASALLLTNTILVNQGTIALNSGGFVMGGSIITNQGVINGPGSYSSSLYNDVNGTVAAQNGTLNLATNGASEAVNNLGTFTIANGSTLSVTPDWNNTNGMVSITGGVLAGGSVTNKGTVVGNGTITSTTFQNLTSGTIKATNGANLNILSTTVVQNGTMIGGSSPNSTIFITNTTAILGNSGTMILDSAAGTTNRAFAIFQGPAGAAQFTNATGGLIQGSGFILLGDFQIGGHNYSMANAGNILATNGALFVQPGDAFTGNGFENLAGGTVTVASASTFGIHRTDNIWNGISQPGNAGVIQLNGGSFTLAGDSGGMVIENQRYFSNAVNGVISGSGTIMGSLNNLGTINATNGNLNINNGSAIIQNGTLSMQNGATLTVLGGAGSLQNNGQMQFAGGTFVGTNFSVLVNAGTISGNGSLNTGRLSGSGGQNQNIINAGGTIIATNGTLLLNPGDAFSGGGFSNAVNGTVVVANNGTLEINRSANAWNNVGNLPNSNPRNLGTMTLAGGTFATYSEGTGDTSRVVENIAGGLITGSGTISATITNLGTILSTGGTLTLQGSGVFRQAGTLNVQAASAMVFSNSAAGLQTFNNAGTIIMSGGTLTAGAITNANWIYGNGTISGAGVFNNSFMMASNGALFAALSSSINASTATIGTLSTNAVLNAQLPGASSFLVNQGTVNMAGGTLLLNNTSGNTISNSNVIIGVGDLTANTIVNSGTVLAANPVSGVSVFSVGIGSVNPASGTIGASNNATLNVVLSGGTSFSNNGSISMVGGSLTINGGSSGTITNNLFVTGVGTVTPAIYNNGTIQATVAAGVLDVNLNGVTNIATGYLGAGSGATLQFENSSVVNLGTIGPVGAGGGTIQFGPGVTSGILSNLGTIQGTANLAFNAFVQNTIGGIIYATNGTVNFDHINGLANAGTINVANNGTFQSNSSNGWQNAGTIDLRGGTLRTGGFTATVNSVSAIFTNNGTIDGYGTLIGGGAFGLASGTAGADKAIVNLGTIVVTNPISGAAVTLFVSTGTAQSQGGIQNLGNIIISSNNTLSLNRQSGLPILNTGSITIQNGNLTGSGILSNDLGGVVQGYGTLTFAMINAAGGTIRATNGLMSMTGSVVPINAGTIEIGNASTMTWDATNSWQNNGTITLLGGTLRTGGPTNAFAGGEPFTNINYMAGFGTIIGGGAFNTNGSGIDKAIINLGTIVANGGTLVVDTGDSTISNGIANFGTMIVSNATDTLDLRRRATPGNDNFIINTGTIIINGGTLTANTAITNQSASGSPGVIKGFGTIALTNQLVNSGTIRSTNGVLSFISPVGSVPLQVTQSGTLAVELGSQMIFGSDSNAPVANSGTILMDGGIFRSGVLTNTSTAMINGYGTMTPSILNSGTLLASGATPLNLLGGVIANNVGGVFGASSGQLFVNAVFTNAGTVSFLNSVGTFNSAVVNKGAWITDPSTNVFYGDYTVAANGYISASAGDVSIFKSNFVNVSTLSNQYNTLKSQFTFNGSGGYTQAFYVAGLNLGGWSSSLQASNEQFFSNVNGTFSTNSFQFAGPDLVLGYTNNFGLGTLQVGDLNTTSTLILADSFATGSVGPDDGKVAGLYVNTLTLDPGSLLIISNNVELYFQTTNGVTGIAFDPNNLNGANVLLLDGASFHELTIIPEPSILMLFSVGSVAILWYRRRRKVASS